MHLDVPDAFIDALLERVEERIRTFPEPWVGVTAAASHLACRPQRIYDLVSRRAIPHRKEGTRLLFKLSHLDAWIESGGAA